MNLSDDPIRHGWNSTSAQGELRKDAIASGRLRQGDIFGLVNCAIIDDRLMIATTPNIGNQFPVSIGDYLDVVFEDGTVLYSYILLPWEIENMFEKNHHFS